MLISLSGMGVEVWHTVQGALQCCVRLQPTFERVGLLENHWALMPKTWGYLTHFENAASSLFASVGAWGWGWSEFCMILPPSELLCLSSLRLHTS